MKVAEELGEEKRRDVKEKKKEAERGGCMEEKHHIQACTLAMVAKKRCALKGSVKSMQLKKLTHKHMLLIFR